MRKSLQLFSFNLISLACISLASAAEPVDLGHQNSTVFQSLAGESFSLKAISSNVDFNGTHHVRYQQYYQDVPVWGADIVAHAPSGTVVTLTNKNITFNGLVYKKITADLEKMPENLQAEKALKEAISLYRKERSIKNTVTHTKINLMIYIDKNNKAHWAYRVQFDTISEKGMPAKPIYILDATTLLVYLAWDNIQTIDVVEGGGIGGNPKLGRLIYDSVGNHLSKLTMQRNPETHTCFLQNAEVRVLDGGRNNAVEQFNCNATNTEHGNIFWNADQDAVNEGYSPADDALYAGRVIKNMYHDWYGTDVLIQDTHAENKIPLLLTMRVHIKDQNNQPMDNAYWDPDTREMSFGDGQYMFYPLTSLGVAAHEISHGFTSQHSDLAYIGQSGGMNESFSDMAAQAAEQYSLNKSSWQIGAELFKQGNRAMRYMDQPSKDCEGTIPLPGLFCSIDNRLQYVEGVTKEVHFTSGLFNRVFYLMSTASGWDAKKAFGVMIQANANYWTSNSTFESAACGVLKATKDYNYDVEAVRRSFSTVLIDVSKC